MIYLLFIYYLQNVHRKAQCRQFATHMYIFVLRAGIVDRDKHFMQYIVRIPVETPNAYVVN